MYFPGDRFFGGDLESPDTLCRHLTIASSCSAAAEDACPAVDWLSKQQVPVGLAGESAGANLVAVAVRSHRAAGLRCQVLIYGNDRRYLRFHLRSPNTPMGTGRRQSI